MPGKLYVRDYGVEIRVDTGIDLTNAISTKLIIQKPNGAEAQWNAEPEPPATSGILKYITGPSDLDQAGIYKLQVEVKFSSTSLTGETCSFRVYNKWE